MDDKIIQKRLGSRDSFGCMEIQRWTFPEKIETMWSVFLLSRCLWWVWTRRAFLWPRGHLSPDTLLLLSSQDQIFIGFDLWFKNYFVFDYFKLWGQFPTSTSEIGAWVPLCFKVKSILCCFNCSKNRIRDNCKESCERVNFCLFEKENEKETPRRASASS